MTIKTEHHPPGVLVWTVDRPEVRNALNWDAMHQFTQLVESAHSQPDLRALIITGSQDTFIAGGDLRELADYPTEADGMRLAQHMGDALRRLEALPCLTIAAIEGAARGGGAEVALACDLRVMAENADLGFVQINLGLTPGWGAGQRLLHLVGYGRALDWLASGHILSAHDAYAHGLANRLAPPGNALRAARQLAQTIASRPPAVIRAIKRMLRSGMLLPPVTAGALEAAEFPPLWAAEDHQQAVSTFLNRDAG